MLSRHDRVVRTSAGRMLAAVLVLAVAVTSNQFVTTASAEAAPGAVPFPEPQALDRVDLTKRKVTRPTPQPRTYAHFSSTGHDVLPAAESTTVALAPAAPAAPARAASAASSGFSASSPWKRAGTTPVSLARPASGAAPKQVQVSTVDRKTAEAAGVRGVMFTLRGEGDKGRVRVAVDSTSFRNAYGGAYESRLRLVSLPACALTTPGREECQRTTPAARSASAPLTAEVAVGAMTVLAATTTASGTGGDYTATSLSPGGTWSTSGNTGSFTYGYPIAVPPAVGGSAPGISLGYNSASQDARTIGTNNQSSWVGDGWSSTESFIQRIFEPCKEVKDSGAPKNDADMCWGGQRLTMSLNGMSAQIVYDDATKTFRATADDATTKIESLTGATNGTRNGEYFRVTENGRQYYFGLNRLPGWKAGDDETRSAWTMPVYKAHAGVSACPDGDFADTACTLGYRFNLDYVVDLHNNATAYYYAPELGYYGPNMKNTAVEYTRGGTLSRIDYGMTASTIYSGTAPAQIVFGTQERCLVGSPTGNKCQDDQFTVAHPEYWPDVPVDLACAKGSTSCTQHAPSFWSRKRLTSITTQVQVGGATKKVDRYDLVHTFPDGGDHAPTMWLESIKHTGLDLLGGATADAPVAAVTFYPVQLANRVGTLAGLPKMYHTRIQNIVSESGAETTVEYSTPNCSGVRASDPGDPDDKEAKAYASTNTTGCFPVYWTPEGQPAPLMDWFYTHPVTKVSTVDRYNAYQDGSQPRLVTEYAYRGKPGWHYDDNEVVKAKYRTWGQFRGYPQVDVTTGDPEVFHYTNGKKVYDRRTLTKTYYFLGMDGDTLPGGKTRDTGPLTSLDGTITVADKNAYAGRIFETATYAGVGGDLDASVVTVPTAIGPTASRDRGGLPALTAQMVRTAKVAKRQATSGGWRRTETASFYNTKLGQSTTGMPMQTADRGETGAAGNVPTCTFVRYLDGKADTVVVGAETIVTAQDCPSAGATPSGTLLSDVRTSFDGNPFAYNGDGQASPAKPSRGDATLVQQASAASGANATAFLDQTAKTYDSYGRVASTTRTPKSKSPDGLSLAQTQYTAYAPASGALPGAVTTIVAATPGVNCAGATTSSADCHRNEAILDAARQVPIQTVEEDGSLTSLTYDALGRLTAVWLPNQSKAGGAKASLVYDYKVSRTGPSVVTTSSLLDNGTYAVSKVLSDAMLRPLEKQLTGKNNTITVNDTQYDSHGWTVLTNNAYAAVGAPADQLVSDRLSQVSIPSTTATDHDALGRITQTTNEHNGVETSRTRTAYTGDTITSVPPAGGVATRTTVDARGRTTSFAQYTTAPTLTGDLTNGFTASGGAAQDITYTYTPAGQQATVTGPDDSVWTFAYDLLGRKTSTKDPDAGTSLSRYDDAGNLVATRDARGIELNYTYDLLGRKLTARDKAKDNFKFASWTYDTLRIGLPTAASRYVNGVTGAYTTSVTGYSRLGKALGRKITLPTSEAPLPLEYTTSYAYSDTAELLAQQRDPSVGGLLGETITYQRDAQGAPTSTTGVDLYVSDTVYGDFGQPSLIRMGASTNQAEVTYAYDEQTLRLSGRTVSRARGIGPVIDEATYTYDQVGNPLSVTDKQSESGNVVTDTQCYRHNSLGRLAEAWTAKDECPAAGTQPTTATVADKPGAYWQTFSYDAIGDRTKVVDHATGGGDDITTTYTTGCTNGCNRTGAQPHTLTSTEGGTDPTKFVYDVAGNLLTRSPTTENRAGQSLNWDDEGHLAKVTTTGNDPKVTSYLYDADGNQLIRRDPGRTTLFAGDTQIVIDTSVTPAKSLGAVRTYSHGGEGSAVAVRSTLPGGGSHYMFTDAHGTGVLAMDTTTQAVTRQQTKPYGEARTSANLGVWPDPTRGFLGAPKDLTTGYTTLGARKYDPSIGRFISADPLLQTTDPNQLGGYAYAADNPITSSDPSGKMVPPDMRTSRTNADGSYKWQPNSETKTQGSTVYTDQHGTPHRVRDTQKYPNPTDEGTVRYLNKHLQTSGELYDASSGNGSQYFLQDEDRPIVGKGTFVGVDGELTVRGTTADAIKVNWLNGKIVSVDSVDFTTGGTKPDRLPFHEQTIRNKMDTSPGSKRQSNLVVFVAQSDSQAASLAERVKDVKNARIIHPSSGFDTGETYSGTHTKALQRFGLKGGTTTRTPQGGTEGARGGSRTGRGGAGAMGALSIVGDLYSAYKLGKALESDDPRARDQFLCDFTMVEAYCIQGYGSDMPMA
ncbi:RHS repeat-associated core domain-containing protein [Actinoplanes sp. NPDC051346]|uniref:RHS repeat domain-containing protein n=1 Tax=Actinoplanes sp. NPDC051346 TaxID=3155048 RepID=UPI00342F2320